MAKLDLSKFKFNLKSITVEPVMFLYMYSTFTNFLTYQALIYDKVCSRTYNSTVCDNLTNKTFKVAEDDVQKTTSMWVLYSNLMMGLPSLFTVVLLLGPWGDKMGRKIPVILPLVGAVLAGTSNLLNAIYMDAAYEYLLIGNFLNGILGAYIAALMSMYSYVAHVSLPEHRTIRIGILEGMIFLAGTLGTATSGVMLDRTSYTFVFSLLVGINFLSLVYTLVWLENVVPERPEDEEVSDAGWCKTFLLDSVRDVACCVYQKKGHKNFMNLCLLVIVMFSLMLTTVGENDILLIFSRHPPLNWSQTTLGLYKGTESFLRGFSVLTLLPLMMKVFHARDTTVAIMGLVSRFAALLVLGVGTKTAVLFVGAVSGVLNGFSSAAIRSMCSSMVNKNEQAKMFSLIGTFESLSALVATSLFNTLYNATLNFYHGFCFLVMAAIIVCCIFIMAFLHWKLAPDESNIEGYSTLTEDLVVNEAPEDNEARLEPVRASR